MPPSTTRSRRRCGQPVPLSTGLSTGSVPGSRPPSADRPRPRLRWDDRRRAGPDRLDRRGTRPGRSNPLVASPRRVALHAHQRDGLRPVAASSPTRMPAGGETAGTLFQIIHSGHTGGIIVTRSVPENVATTATPDSRASTWCRSSQRRTAGRNHAEVPGAQVHASGHDLDQHVLGTELGARDVTEVQYVRGPIPVLHDRLHPTPPHRHPTHCAGDGRPQAGASPEPKIR